MSDNQNIIKDGGAGGGQYHVSIRPPQIRNTMLLNHSAILGKDCIAKCVRCVMNI